jgi:ketosteroid isomerase-like protein
MSEQQLRQANVEIVRRFIDAINRWDLDAQRSMLHPDMVYAMPFAPPGFDRLIEGAENYLAFEKAAMESLVGSENLHDLRVESLSSDPGELIAFFKSDMVFKATGRAYRNDYISHWIIRDGRIIYFGEYLDPIRLTVALGGSVRQATLEGPGRS